MSQDWTGELTPEATILAVFERRMRGDYQTWREDVSARSAALRALDSDQARALAGALWARWRESDDIVDLLAWINVRFPGALASIWPEMIERGVFRPGWLYLGAPPDVTERLLALTDQQGGSSGHNNLLLALAWIGDERVVSQFQACRKQPPAWQSRLFIPAYDYATEAGWELTPTGEKRQLYWAECYQLTRDDQNPDADAASEADQPDAGTCGWCNRPLCVIFDNDLSDPRVAFLTGGPSAGATRLRIANCLWCSGFATTYTDIDPRGGSAWSAENGPKPAIFEHVGNGEDVIPLDASTLYSTPQILGEACANPFEALGRALLDESSVSQVGGYPEWIQDAEYPICPTCHQRMRCAGQTTREDEEGLTYAFLCLDCGKAATVYQQT